MDPNEADEALVEEVLLKTLRGFDKLVSPEELVLMRELIRADLLYDPKNALLLRQARPDPTVQQSGDVPVDEAAHAAAQEKKKKQKKQGKAG